MDPHVETFREVLLALLTCLIVAKHIFCNINTILGLQRTRDNHSLIFKILLMFVMSQLAQLETRRVNVFTRPPSSMGRIHTFMWRNHKDTAITCLLRLMKSLMNYSVITWPVVWMLSWKTPTPLHTASSLRPHTHFLSLRAVTIKTLSAED